MNYTNYVGQKLTFVKQPTAEEWFKVGKVDMDLNTEWEILEYNDHYKTFRCLNDMGRDIWIPITAFNLDYEIYY